MFKKAVELLGGSFVVYFAVVACGSSPGGEKPVASTGGETATGGRDRGGSGGTESAGFGFGGIPDPTPDAGAAEAGDGPGPTVCDCQEPPDPYVPPEPLLVEAECDVRVGVSSSGTLYAEAPRPDLPELNLLQGIAILEFAAEYPTRPPGHKVFSTTGVSLSETTVAIPCGGYGPGQPEPPETVRFVFPR